MEPTLPVSRDTASPPAKHDIASLLDDASVFRPPAHVLPPQWLLLPRMQTGPNEFVLPEMRAMLGLAPVTRPQPRQAPVVVIDLTESSPSPSPVAVVATPMARPVDGEAFHRVSAAAHTDTAPADAAPADAPGDADGKVTGGEVTEDDGVEEEGELEDTEKPTAGKKRRRDGKEPRQPRAKKPRDFPRDQHSKSEFLNRVSHAGPMTDFVDQWAATYVEIYDTPDGRDSGLKAKVAIPRRLPLVIYGGEVVPDGNIDALDRYGMTFLDNDLNTWCVRGRGAATAAKRDHTKIWNAASLANHRCRHPNCEFAQYTDETRAGGVVIFLRPFRPIEQGEELTANYNEERTSRQILGTACLCVDCKQDRDPCAFVAEPPPPPN